MGELYREKKDDVNASYYFYQAARLAPDAEPPQEALAAFGPASDWTAKAQEAQAAGDTEAAVKNILVARNLDPRDLAAARLHGAILAEDDKPKDAIEVYIEALKLGPKDQQVLKALKTLESENAKVAIKVYKERLKKDPADSVVESRLDSLQQAK